MKIHKLRIQSGDAIELTVEVFKADKLRGIKKKEVKSIIQHQGIDMKILEFQTKEIEYINKFHTINYGTKRK